MLVQPGMKVKIIKEDSPLLGMEFTVRSVDLEEQSARLENQRGEEITLPFNYMKGDTSYSPEVLFEFDDCLVDGNLNPNKNIIGLFNLCRRSFTTGILSYRVFEDNDTAISTFIENNIHDNASGYIPVVGVAGKGTRLIVSNRVARVSDDGIDICPMCIVNKDKYFTYTADINQTMFDNVGGLVNTAEG